MRQMASNLTANDDDGVSKGLTLTFLLIAIGIILPIYQVLQAQKMSYACFNQIHLYIRKVFVHYSLKESCNIDMQKWALWCRFFMPKKMMIIGGKKRNWRKFQFHVKFLSFSSFDTG